MKFKLLGDHITPAEKEGTVRTYHCTALASRLLGLKAQGFLTVTNKRVVFYALGSSYAGRSVLSSEVPIADVSGISTYKGTYFSIGHFLTAIVVSFVAGNILSLLIGGLVTILLTLLLQEAFNGSSIEASLITIGLFGVSSLLVSAAFAKDRIWRPVFATVGTLLLAGPGVLGLARDAVSQVFGGASAGLGSLMAIAAFFAGIYTLITMFWYARREGMSLTIGSKGGATTPIAISGVSVFGLFNTAALKALNAEPAPDAATMIKELGALISDIQTTGDLAAQKWARKGSEPIRQSSEPAVQT